MHALFRFALAIAISSTSLACATGERALWETGLPWVKAKFEVTSLTPREGFLDVILSGGGVSRRVFARATQDCESVFATGESVTLGRSDRYGPAERDGLECPLSGIGDLKDWRTSRTIGGVGRSPIRRSSVRITIVASDSEYFYARGGFSIAALLSWSPGTDQVVALLPRIEECAAIEAGGFFSVLFREVGTPALGVVAGDGLCPIAGLIAVVPGDFGGDAARP